MTCSMSSYNSLSPSAMISRNRLVWGIFQRSGSYSIPNAELARSPGALSRKMNSSRISGRAAAFDAYSLYSISGRKWLTTSTPKLYRKCCLSLRQAAFPNSSIFSLSSWRGTQARTRLLKLAEMQRKLCLVASEWYVCWYKRAGNTYHFHIKIKSAMTSDLMEFIKVVRH